MYSWVAELIQVFIAIRVAVFFLVLGSAMKYTSKFNPAGTTEAEVLVFFFWEIRGLRVILFFLLEGYNVKAKGHSEKGLFIFWQRVR